MSHCTNRRQFILTRLAALAAARSGFTAQNEEVTNLTLKQASDLIRAKKVSPVELTEACLSRIKVYSPKMNAFITVMREKALEQAKQLEQEQMAGRFRSPLHGIPLGIKDNIDTAGTRANPGRAGLQERGSTPESAKDGTLRQS